MSEKPMMTTAFYSIFKGKLDKMKQELKEELERAKSDRRKDWLKKQIKETKNLNKTVKEMEKQMGNDITCPKCGHHFTK